MTTPDFRVWGSNTPHGYRFRERVYIADVLEGQEPVPTKDACRQARAILREHGRPMSFTLLRSRTVPPMPALLLASCLAHMIEQDMGVGLDDWDLFEAIS